MRARMLLGGMAATLAMMVAAHPAAATTVTMRPIAPISPNVVVHTKRETFVCGTGIIPATEFENNSTGKALAVNSNKVPTFSGCEAFLNEYPASKGIPFKVTVSGATGPWTYPVDAAGLHIQIPKSLLTFVFSPECNIEFEGTLKTEAVAAGHPATISKLPFNNSPMTIKAVNGAESACYLMKNYFEDGKPASFSATYEVTPPFTLE